MKGRLWITWEKQRRNRTLSAELNAVLVEYLHDLPRPIRYPYLIMLTLSKILHVRPSVLFVQNPSIVLSFFSVFFCKLLQIPVVVDAHNSGVFPFGGKWPAGTMLCNMINRAANYVIVTNPVLKQHVESNGGRCLILPDPIPEISICPDRNNKRNQIEILFVCSWSPDEPYEEVIRAADMLDDSMIIYITGNNQKVKDKLSDPLPSNIILTGYLPDNEYEKLLGQVDIVMDLTTFDDCLVCGAYESVAAEKPIILSNNTASRAYFNKGVVHVDNKDESIMRGIKNAIRNLDKLNDEISQFKNDAVADWCNLLAAAEEKLRQLEKKAV